MEQILMKGNGHGRRQPSPNHGPENPTPPPPARTSLQVENEKLKTLLAQRDTENEALAEKIKRLEGELVWEIGTSGDMIGEMVNMKELVQEKDVEIQGLKEALLKEGIQMGDRTAEVGAQEEKVLQHFPDVLKTLVSMNYTSWRGHLRHLLPTCRLVCKSWKQSVDAFMQEESPDLFRRCFSKRFPPYPLMLAHDKFDNHQWSDKLKIISHSLRTSSSYNPIPSRHLMLELTIDQDSKNWNEYSRMVTRYLQVLGKEARILTVCFRGYEEPSSNDTVVCRLLSEWLSLVPNITSLLLCTCTWRHQLGSQVDFGKVSFPNLKDLKAFQCFRNAPLLNYNILRNNRQITKLVLSSEYSSVFDAPPSLKLTEIDFPNLSTLSCFLHHPDDWQVLGEITWKLEHLSLDCDDYVSPALKQFVDDLERFGTTLTSLAINLAIFGTRNLEEVKLNLPNLKCLRIVITDWESDPIGRLVESLESLETFSLELKVSLSGDHLQYPWYPIQQGFYDYVNSVFGMVDWMKLPNLTGVKVTARVHGEEAGYRNVFALRRIGMPSLKFDIVKIDESDYRWDSESESELNFSPVSS